MDCVRHSNGSMKESMEYDASVGVGRYIGPGVTELTMEATRLLDEMKACVYNKVVNEASGYAACWPTYDVIPKATASHSTLPYQPCWDLSGPNERARDPKFVRNG